MRPCQLMFVRPERENQPENVTALEEEAGRVGSVRNQRGREEPECGVPGSDQGVSRGTPETRTDSQRLGSPRPMIRISKLGLFYFMTLTRME